MPAFSPFESSYSNHIGSCAHPVNSTVYMLVTWRLNGTGPFSLQVWEHPPPYTALPILKRSWKQGEKDQPVGPFGYGSLLCLPNGSLHIAIPQGPDNVNQIKPSIRIEPNMCAPFTPGIGSSDPRVDALISQLGALGQQVAQIETALGNSAASGTGLTLFSAPRTAAAWEGRQLSGGESVDIPAVFGVPPASAYLIRFVAQAAKADIRVRAGSEAAPYFVTVNTQAPGLQVHTQGWVPGPTCYVSTVNGVASVWLQLLGIG